MSAWQMLPVNPEGLGNSPYNSFSSFAGNPLLIDLKELVADGLLKEEELSALHEKNDPELCNFEFLREEKPRLLRLAFSRFSDFSRLSAFEKAEESWLSDYASFMAIKDLCGGVSWQEFPEALRNRSGLADFRREHTNEENFYKFEQMLFFAQWRRLRSYANEKGISLIGDLPIYVALDSVDVWANPDVFTLDESLVPKLIAGCPPDSFCLDGQLWGNPIYDWDYLKNTNYAWWRRRISHIAEMFDTVRLDHFRAFESYWAIPQGSETAATGEWVKGPGKEFFDIILKDIPVNIIAEDLGSLTEEVFILRDACGFPGMKVLQFAFDSGEENLYLPDKYPENCVAYTGTHDNNTTLGWQDDVPQYKIDFAVWYLKPREGETLTHAFLRGTWASRAKLAIAPIQDFLELPASARMNTPGLVTERNWRFRLSPDALCDELAEELFRLNSDNNRI